MADVDIDRLRISIEAKASSAVAGVNRLANEVKSLRSAAGGSTATNLQNLSKAIDGVGADPSAAQSIRAVAEAVKAFKGASVPKSIAPNLAAVAEAASSLSGSDAVTQLAQNLRAFKGVSVPKSIAPNLVAAGEAARSVGKTGNAAQLAKNLQGFNDVKVSKTIGANLSSIADAVAKMGDSSKVKRAAENVWAFNGLKISSSIGNQLRNMAEGLAVLNAVPVRPQKFETLARSLSALTAVQKGDLNSLIRSLKKLPEAIEGLQSVDLTGFARQCQRITAALGDLPSKMAKVSAGFKSINRAANSSGAGMSKSMRGASDEAEGLFQRLWKMGKAITTLSVLHGAFQQVTGVFAGAIDKANKYVEDMNLFNVALGDYAQQAQGYAEQVSSRMGINIQDWLRNQGTFTTMAKGMGVATDSANTMGQQLTQLSYDLASLYNTTDAEAFEKVRAGLAGELEPLRALGFDLSEARLQQDAYSLGITKSVQSMTQAEKAQLRYYAIMNQVTWAHQDMARSLDSPANTMRIFAGEVNTAATNIGKAFLPMLQAIMPVAIAAARVVATLGNALASLTGGNQIADVNYAQGDTGLGGLSDSADQAASALDAAEDASDNASTGIANTGRKAAKTTKQVKELKRQLMGFDEINMFTRDTPTDTSSNGGSTGGGSKSPSKGKGGSGSGAGAVKIPIDRYTFIGGDMIGKDIYDKMMAMIKRLGKAFAPLVDAVKPVVAAIRHQFEGLDLAGAAANALAGFANLVSNFVRNVVEILGPLLVAFNFPETLAVALDGAAQLFLTFSALINGVGTVVKNFSDTALVPLVAWIGDVLRGAIRVCIAVLKSWQDWFINNSGALAQLGKAAGKGAALVLALARAVADVAFGAAATVFVGLNTAIQGVLTVLVNSGAARSAVYLLSAALTALALGNGLAMGLQALANGFWAMATRIAEGSAKGEGAIRLFSSNAIANIKGAAANLNAGMQLMAEAIGNRLKPFTDRAVAGLKKLTVTARGAWASTKNLSYALFTAAGRQDYHARKIVNANLRLGEARKAADEAQAAYEREAHALEALKSGLGTNASLLEKLSLKQLSATTSVFKANSQLAQNKVKLAEAKVATQAYAAQNGVLSAGVLRLRAAELQAGAAVAGSVAKKTLAGAASRGLAVAEGAATVASGALATAMNLIPGMALATALTFLLSNLDKVIPAIQSFGSWLRQTFAPIDFLCSLVEKACGWINNLTGGVLGKVAGAVGGVIGSFLGLSDATAEVSDTTEEANQVLDEEAQQVEQNLQSIDKYKESHNNLGDALAVAAGDTDRFNQYLKSTGQTFDDVKSRQEQFTQSTINSFGKIDTSQSMHFETMKKNLEANIQTQQQWSANMKSLMERTGLDSNNALIKGLLEAGPDKVGSAVQEALNDPTGQKLSELKNIAKNAGATLDPETAFGISSTGGQKSKVAAGELASGTAGSMDGKAGAKQKGKETSDAYGSGVGQGGKNAKSQAEKAKNSAISGFNGGDGYKKAKSAGRNMMGGFGDGLKEAMGNNIYKAAKRAAVSAQEGMGSNYQGAKSAGRNEMGGFIDGLKEGMGRQAWWKGRDAAKSAQDGMGSNYGGANSAGRSLMGGFVQGLVDGMGKEAWWKGHHAAVSAADGMKGNWSGAHDAGKNEMGGFIDGLRDGMGRQAWWKGRDAAKSAQDGLGSNYWGAHSAGRNLMGGYMDGMERERSSVYWKAYGIAREAVKAVNRAQNSHSPSRETMKSGRWFGMGYANGIQKQAGEVVDRARSMVSDALDVTDAAGRMGRAAGEAFAGGVDLSGAADAFSLAEANARRAPSALATTKAAAASRVSPHGPELAMSDDADVAQAVSRAVTQALVSVDMGRNGGSAQGGGTTVVLRVGNEELARAVAKGNDSLARRGVLRLG